MPIYEYQCQACQEELEVLRKISDEPLVDCPACGKPALNKKVSAAAFRLKGGGWYETDFKTGNKKNLAGGSEGGKDASGDGKSDNKSDSKSDNKAASASGGNKSSNESKKSA